MGQASTQQDASGVHPSSADAALIAEIGGAMCTTLVEGNAVVCIATGTHRRLLERQLSLRGIDVVAALHSEQFVSLNALEVLSKVIIGGLPDVNRFAEVVGSLVDRTVARYPRVLIFGELVALMRADGQLASAIELENLWGSFTAARPSVLRHCEYPALASLGRTSVAFTHRAGALPTLH
jgi:hypothetical protein